MDLLNSLFFPSILTLLLIWAMVTDLQRFIIPNWLNATIIILYPLACWVLSPILDWQMGLLGFAVLFTIGYIIFALGIAGGGDVKLLAALALWIGFNKTLIDFVLLMAVLGGILTLCLLLIRRIMPYVFMRAQWSAQRIPQVCSDNQPIPYGIAIAGAFLWLLWTHQFTFFPA
jgi:prepilin peptidase CpaA